MKKLKNIIGIIISLATLILVAAICIVCFIPTFMYFHIFNLFCSIINAIIPAMFCYGLASAIMEVTKHPGLKNTLILLSIVFGIVIIAIITIMFIL